MKHVLNRTGNECYTLYELCFSIQFPKTVELGRRLWKKKSKMWFEHGSGAQKLYRILPLD
ncbi:MAG: hypothetical protein BAA01_11805 [Bacillus thermozeamaize]|uniref:Uncharacterized protein n=1 Tax=Bacillus thermozeamaize TaxID=230954 RepID=A0A1Y3PH55_9BACI|nr:MAG: hypothetical protein BAA01_11805 [Bacillus thermozeamaize]